MCSLKYPSLSPNTSFKVWLPYRPWYSMLWMVNTLLVSQSWGDAVALLQQIDGHQGGLPVVAVEHVWMPVQPAHALHHSPGEVGEALAIVVVAVKCWNA